MAHSNLLLDFIIKNDQADTGLGISRILIHNINYGHLSI